MGNTKVLQDWLSPPDIFVLKLYYIHIDLCIGSTSLRRLYCFSMHTAFISSPSRRLSLDWIHPKVTFLSSFTHPRVFQNPVKKTFLFFLHKHKWEFYYSKTSMLLFSIKLHGDHDCRTGSSRQDFGKSVCISICSSSKHIKWPQYRLRLKFLNCTDYIYFVFMLLSLHFMKENSMKILQNIKQSHT